MIWLKTLSIILGVYLAGFCVTFLAELIFLGAGESGSLAADLKAWLRVAAIWPWLWLGLIATGPAVLIGVLCIPSRYRIEKR